MRLARVAVAALAVLFCADLAAASAVPVNNDVNFGVKDPTCTGSCILITSSTFSFTMPSVPPGTTVTLDFENSPNNATLSSLMFDLFTGTSVTPNLFTCTVAAFFDTCLVTQITSTIPGDNEYQIILKSSGNSETDDCESDDEADVEDSCGGIPPGGVFQFTFTNPPGTDPTLDWAGAGLTVNVTATPEPGTLALLASGLIPLWTLRRKWRS